MLLVRFNGFVQDCGREMLGLYNMKETPMRLSVSKTRKHFGAVLMKVQNPNDYVVITRYGKAIAGVVSIAGLNRIWEIEDEERDGKIRHPLFDMGHYVGAKVTVGRDGKTVTTREAALQLRTLQLERAEERRVLREGGLEPVEGGELREERVVAVEGKRRWWFW
jgi:PHD/YefM family antitoxin component YafN of YafNO toxin-antitoxin module